MFNRSLLSPRKKYLLALSGGRDSVCLLHLLLENQVRRLHLVHLNHGLRGKESDEHARFVRSLARQHQLPLTLVKSKVAQLAERESLSLETAARIARHQLFATTAKATRCHRLLLAHHADDQAETILFNLLRGSAGLKGMADQSTLTINSIHLQILRPLLTTRRSTIDDYLSSNKISFREDSSNTSAAHTRNRLRHEALPLLTDIMARDIVPAVLRAEELNRQQNQTLDTLLNDLHLLDSLGRLHLPTLRPLSPAIQRAALHRYLSHHRIRDLSKRLLDDAMTLLQPDSTAKINLPGGQHLIRRSGRIFLSPT